MEIELIALAGADELLGGNVNRNFTISYPISFEDHVKEFI